MNPSDSARARPGLPLFGNEGRAGLVKIDLKSFGHDPRSSARRSAFPVNLRIDFRLAQGLDTRIAGSWPELLDARV
jgi:hypothetical protein